jgi:Alpha-L-fucosidase
MPMLKAQVKPDGPFSTSTGEWERTDGQWGLRELSNAILAQNPTTVLNGRIPTHADYATPEQALPFAAPDGPWELCLTINDSWGYQGHDTNYKSVKLLVRYFAETIGLGGNLLLDESVTPARRQIPPVVVSYSEKSSCHTSFGLLGGSANAALRALASSRRSPWWSTGWSRPRARSARSTVEVDARCPSTAIRAWIFRWPQAGQSAAYFAATGSTSSRIGAGHGPLATGFPARCLASCR